MKALRAAAHEGGARVQQGWLHKFSCAKSAVAAHGWRRGPLVLHRKAANCSAGAPTRRPPPARRDLPRRSTPGRDAERAPLRAKSTPLVPALGKGRRRRRPFRRGRGGGRRRASRQCRSRSLGCRGCGARRWAPPTSPITSSPPTRSKRANSSGSPHSRRTPRLSSLRSSRPPPAIDRQSTGGGIGPTSQALTTRRQQRPTRRGCRVQAPQVDR